jgi:thiamine-phosphate diphosphorylase
LPTLSTILGERKPDLPVQYAISNRLFFREVSTIKYLKALFQAPAQVIQWREKDLSVEKNRDFVRAGSELASELGKIFVINSVTELALQEGADGVHLTSQQNLDSAVRLRRSSGSVEFLIGKSAHSVAEVISAERQGADYVLLAPILDPISKGSYTPALGIEALREAVESVSIPVFALGGMIEENAHLAVEAGAYGFAGISWVYPYLNRILEDS